MEDPSYAYLHCDLLTGQPWPQSLS
jgi:hypothetical protein